MTCKLTFPHRRRRPGRGSHTNPLLFCCFVPPQDKYAQKVHFKAAGVPLPEFREVKCRGCMEGTAKAFGLPFMLKAKRSAGAGVGRKGWWEWLRPRPRLNVKWWVGEAAGQGVGRGGGSGETPLARMHGAPQCPRC